MTTTGVSDIDIRYETCDPESEDTTYCTPDGTLWESEQAYRDARAAGWRPEEGACPLWEQGGPGCASPGNCVCNTKEGDT